MKDRKSFLPVNESDVRERNWSEQMPRWMW